MKDNTIDLGQGPLTIETYCISEKRPTFNKNKTATFFFIKTRKTFRTSGICSSCNKKKSNIISRDNVPNNLKKKVNI